MELQRPRRTFGDAHCGWVIVPLMCMSAVLATLVITFTFRPGGQSPVTPPAAGSHAAGIPSDTASQAALESPRPGAASGAALDGLRRDASWLDAEASRLLASTLLARYEAGGDTDALYEALLWIERDWSSPQWLETKLVNRFVERHCDQEIVRWSRLCERGE